MSTSERTLAGLLGGLLAVVVLGFVAYRFVISPMLKRNDQIAALQSDINTKENDLFDIIAAKQKFEATRAMSLPGDVKISRGLYSRLLKSLLERAGFPAGSFKLVVAEADSKSAPVIQGKKVAYTKLNYEVTAKGEMFYFVEFLKQFYNQPLLHMVKKLNVQRPSDGKAQAKGELDFTMTVEAIVLDNATDRGVLFSPSRETIAVAGGLGATGVQLNAFETGKGSPIPAKDVLAEPKRDYQTISAKNMFYGVLPPPVEKKERVVRDNPPEDDISVFITLTSIIGHPNEGEVIAVFRDKLNNNEYTVTRKGYRISVEATYDLNGRRKNLYKAGGQEIIYGSEEGQNKRVFRVRSLTASEVILEEIYADKEKEKPSFPLMMAGGFWSAISVTDKVFGTISVGQNMENITPILTREAFRGIYGQPLQLPPPEDKGR